MQTVVSILPIVLTDTVKKMSVLGIRIAKDTQNHYALMESVWNVKTPTLVWINVCHHMIVHLTNLGVRIKDVPTNNVFLPRNVMEVLLSATWVLLLVRKIVGMIMIVILNVETVMIVMIVMIVIIVIQDIQVMIVQKVKRVKIIFVWEEPAEKFNV